MWLPILSFIITFGLFFYKFQVTVPLQYATYMGVALLAGLDSVLGGLRSVSEHRFKSSIFVSGFFANALLAAALAYLGDQYGIPLYMAAVFAFGVRIFQNLASLRRFILESLSKRDTGVLDSLAPRADAEFTAKQE
ncbi:MAG: small basic family protein [bacterium]|jgi:small basic protein|nr:small basic family protein [bacterium]MDD3804851.1 small basic family protein [bacterium]MDD4152266.1 small basic family protein [bacterium]MDD4558157.1 small basic family protein [bacterium]